MDFKDKVVAVAKNLKFDKERIVEQGRRAYRAMFKLRANPFKSDSERFCWENGWKAEEMVWEAMMERWKEIDRQERVR